MRGKKIFETPEEVSLPNLSYNRYGEPINHNEKISPWMEDKDAYPFFMISGDLIIGRRGDIHNMPPNRSRNSGYYPGRFWLDKKIISFWEYPPEGEFFNIIRHLEDKIGINILDDRNWRVEIPPEPFSENPWRRDKDFTSYLIPCKEYPIINKKEKKNMKKTKLVPESLEEILEGVADKYAEKHWGIRDEEEEFNRRYNQSNIGEKINSYIIKNPRSLNSLPKGCRGVITRDGDLYVATEDIIHVDILKDLKKLDIIESSPTGWEDIDNNKNIDFITVQRVWGKDVFGIGESYMLPKSKHMEERKKALEFFIPFLKKAKDKNPKYKFINEQIRQVSRELLNTEEYEEFKTKGS